MSLKQFIGLCARAQLLQSSEEGPYGKAGRSKGLSMTEVRALVDVFDSVDQRPGGRIGAVPHFPGDGLLERDQLATAIQLGGYNPTQTEVDDHMKTFDTDGTGWVTKQEYLLIMGRLPTSQGTFSTQQYAKLLQLFDMYDAGGAGLIALPELKALFWRLDVDLAKGALAAAVRKLFRSGVHTPLDKQTVVSILSHVKARMDQYARLKEEEEEEEKRSPGAGEVPVPVLPGARRGRPGRGPEPRRGCTRG